MVNQMTTDGLEIIQIKLIQWERSYQILGDFTTCMAMSGNGAKMTGMINIMVHQMMVLLG
jgi:hypothetical protein